MKIDIENLTKIIGGNVILDDISMNLESGKIYGFVGRNGSGKTMLMRHILGFTYATSGSVKIDGKELGKDIDGPDNVGAIIENPGFLPEISGYKNLKILAAIKGTVGKKEIMDMIESVGLDPRDKRPVKKYSLGMRQRLGLAQALMENPNLLILDEPMNGLDNEGVEEIRKVLMDKKTSDRLIIIASHNEYDIKYLCDEIFLFDKGKKLKQNSGL